VKKDKRDFHRFQGVSPGPDCKKLLRTQRLCGRKYTRRFRGGAKKRRRENEIERMNINMFNSPGTDRASREGEKSGVRKKDKTTSQKSHFYSSKTGFLILEKVESPGDEGIPGGSQEKPRVSFLCWRRGAGAAKGGSETGLRFPGMRSRWEIEGQLSLSIRLSNNGVDYRKKGGEKVLKGTDPEGSFWGRKYRKRQSLPPTW